MWINTQGFPDEVSWDLENADGDIVAGAEGYTGGDEFHELCLEDGCYTLNLYDSFGDGWNGGFYMMYDDDGLIADGSLFYGSWQLDVISINSDCDSDGCTDPTAINFDADATIDDGSCVYGGGNGFNGGGNTPAMVDSFTFTFAPNPVVLVSKLTFGNIKDETGIAVKVIDLSGRIVHQELLAVTGPTMTVSFNFSHLAAGNYIVQAQNGGESTALQIVKMN
jgi:hypothetical protein